MPLSGCCEHWQELDDEVGDDFEYCRAIVSGKVYGRCSCSGLREECNNGQYMPQIHDDPREDR